VVGIGLASPCQRLLKSSRSPAKIAKRIESSGLDSRIRPNTSQQLTLTRICERRQRPDDKLEDVCGGQVAVDKLWLEDDNVHDDVAGGDEGVAGAHAVEADVVHDVGGLYQRRGGRGSSVLLGA
jgi:hypothetical protein